MSKEIDLINELESHKTIKDNDEDHIIKRLPAEINTFDSKDLEVNQLIKEDRMEMRQDVMVYTFNFKSSCQAIAIILGSFMLFNGFLYVFFTTSSDPYPDWRNIYNWIIFIESGLLILTSGMTVHRRELVVKPRHLRKNINPRVHDLKFAFAHSITYFIAGICMLVLSLMISNIIG